MRFSRQRRASAVRVDGASATRGRRGAPPCVTWLLAPALAMFATHAWAQWPPPAGSQAAQPGAPPGVPPPQPGAPANAPYGQPMEAGGLAPPPPMASTTPPPPSTTEQQLEDAKKEDSGRGLSWVWLNVEGGYQHVGLQTFSYSVSGGTPSQPVPDVSAGFIPTTANGGVIGPGVGFRLLFLTIGARGRLGFFDNFQLFSLGPELGFHIPLGNLEPHFDFSFGYTAMGSFKGAVSGSTDAISIRGFDARIGGGLDYFVTPVVSLGANVSWEFLGLTRPGVDAATVQRIGKETTLSQAQSDALLAKGTSYGSALAITGVVGLHF